MASHRLTRTEFDEFADGSDLDFERRTAGPEVGNGFEEYLYAAPLENGFELTLFSSVPTETDEIRDDHRDNILVRVAHEANDGDEVFSRPPVPRTSEWQDNVEVQFEKVRERIQDTVECEACGAPMIRWQGHFMEFYGCVVYDCEQVQDIVEEVDQDVREQARTEQY